MTFTFDKKQRSYQCPKCFGLFDKNGFGPHFPRCRGAHGGGAFEWPSFAGWVYWLTWGPLMLFWISFMVWIVTGWLRSVYSQVVFSQAEWALREVMRWAMGMFHGVNREFATPPGSGYTHNANPFSKGAQAGQTASP